MVPERYCPCGTWKESVMTKNCFTCGETSILDRDIQQLYSQRCIECEFGDECHTMWYPIDTIPVDDPERVS